MADFPGAEGARRPWETLPAHVRDEIESRVGSRVAVAATQPGGFSPGVAARLTMRTGERVFVKAVSSAPNPDSPGFHRREAAVAAALPASAPTPRLRFVVDDGDTVALVFDDIDGRSPLLPWTSADLDLVLEAVDRLSHTLTPSPIALAPASEHLATTFTGWRSLRGDAGRAARLEPDWRARLDALADLEAGWAGGAGGSTLLHLDLRADNLLIGRDGVVVVDWPHACVGAAWIDLAGLLPSVAMQGGPPPSAIWSAHPVARPAPRDAVDGVVAALAGFFTSQSLLPDPPGLPTPCVPGRSGARSPPLARRATRFRRARRCGEGTMTTMPNILERAETFVLRDARVLDRHRFAFHFGDGPPGPVVDALAAYRNDDGGYGHALEPDLRSPASQPVPVEHALRILREVGVTGGAIVDDAVVWIERVAAEAGGGLPFVLPGADRWPCAPWWAGGTGEPSINPTAGICALLPGRLPSIEGWVRNAIAADPLDAAYTVSEAAVFAPDDERIRAAARAVVRAEITGLCSHPPDTPLDFPAGFFDDKTIEGWLDHLMAEQEPDGGWPIAWTPPSAAAGGEWRGFVTVNSLLTLRKAGRA